MCYEVARFHFRGLVPPTEFLKKASGTYVGETSDHSLYLNAGAGDSENIHAFWVVQHIVGFGSTGERSPTPRTSSKGRHDSRGTKWIDREGQIGWKHISMYVRGEEVVVGFGRLCNNGCEDLKFIALASGSFSSWPREHAKRDTGRLRLPRKFYRCVAFVPFRTHIIWAQGN